MPQDLGVLPRWDVSNVFPSLDSPAYAAALQELDQRLTEHEAALDRDGIGGAHARFPQDDGPLVEMLVGYVTRTNWLLARYGRLDAYISAFTTTNTFDDAPRRRGSELEDRMVRLDGAGVRFLAWSRGLEGRIAAVAQRHPLLAQHRFVLEETVERARHQMSEAEELLAADLSPAGGAAWRRLHGILTSQIEVPLTVDGKAERLPMTRIRALAADRNPEVRRQAYEAELAAWKQWQEPIAACMNGVKGWALRLNKRRGYGAAIEPSLEQARIDRPTLDALLAAMQGSLPTFRRYFKAKARNLNKAQLSWHDLLAPVGQASRVWRWEEAERFVVTCFQSFSERLGSYARTAFAGRWIDAEPRLGKVGGAFCMGVPEVKESRILLQFDGTFDQVFTLAHELGHGYHNEVLKDREPLLTTTPMTLAETASIFCETIVFNAALQQARDAGERRSILDTHLVGAAQVVVDIYSRYRFESRLFERREQSELSATDLCAMMTEAQQEAYGDGLDDRRHPYMWAVKPHYYAAELSFYNYPYAFGLLFALGLYALFQKRGASFVAAYDGLLGSTGLGKAAELAARFDIDIRQKSFWDGGLEHIAKLVTEYEGLGQ